MCVRMREKEREAHLLLQFYICTWIRSCNLIWAIYYFVMSINFERIKFHDIRDVWICGLQFKPNPINHCPILDILYCTEWFIFFMSHFLIVSFENSNLGRCTFLGIWNKSNTWQSIRNGHEIRWSRSHLLVVILDNNHTDCVIRKLYFLFSLVTYH